jgi:hypothetical protein
VLKSIISYERDKIFHSSKLIIPILVLIVFFGVAYAYAPVNILNSFSFSSLVVYFFMLSIGVMNDDLSYPMIDQSIIVKMKHRSYFYVGKVFLIILIGFALSLISVGIPLLINAAINNTLFIRGVVLSDVISGVVLFWLIGISGGVSGLYANNRIYSNRKVAVTLSVLFGVYVVIEGPVIAQLPMLGFFRWLFPPVYELSAVYSKTSFFDINNSLFIFLWLVAYIIIEIVFYVIIMMKRKFE